MLGGYCCVIENEKGAGNSIWFWIVCYLNVWVYSTWCNLELAIICKGFLAWWCQTFGFSLKNPIYQCSIFCWNPASSIWGISSIFNGTENQSSAREVSKSTAHREPTYNIDHTSSIIHLREVHFHDRCIVYINCIKSCLIFLFDLISASCNFEIFRDLFGAGNYWDSCY